MYTEIRHASWNQPLVSSLANAKEGLPTQEALTGPTPNNLLQEDKNDEAPSSTQGNFYGRVLSQVVDGGFVGSNRGAVVGGVLLGSIAGLSGGDALGGVLIGSNLGTSLGATVGMINGISEKNNFSASNDKTLGIEETSGTEDLLTGSSDLMNHTIEMVDHAGHVAATSSITGGVAVFIGSLMLGIPLGGAVHGAISYSGAAWMFGLTTGAGEWILRALNRDHVSIPDILTKMTVQQPASPLTSEIEMMPVSSQGNTLMKSE